MNKKLIKFLRAKIFVVLACKRVWIYLLENWAVCDMWKHWHVEHGVCLRCPCIRSVLVWSKGKIRWGVFDLAGLYTLVFYTWFWALILALLVGFFCVQFCVVFFSRQFFWSLFFWGDFNWFLLQNYVFWDSSLKSFDEYLFFWKFEF